MKRTIILCIIAFLTMLPFSVKAEEIIIDEDTLTCEDIVFSILYNRTYKTPAPYYEYLTYYLVYRDCITNEYVYLDADSLWITTNNSSIQIRGINDPANHNIDILYLERGGPYNLWARYKNCYYGKMFHKRLIQTTPEAIENIPYDSSPVPPKIFENGQVLIRSGKETYDVQGKNIGK